MINVKSMLLVVKIVVKENHLENMHEKTRTLSIFQGECHESQKYEYMIASAYIYILFSCISFKYTLSNTSIRVPTSYTYAIIYTLICFISYVPFIK